MVNFKVRFKNPVFIAQFILAIFTPILAYAGLTAADLTTWKALGDLIVGAISNPYVLSLVAVSVWNCINDPTTPGLIQDSERAKSYTVPGIDEDEWDFSVSDESEEIDEETEEEDDVE